MALEKTCQYEVPSKTDAATTNSDKCSRSVDRVTVYTEDLSKNRLIESAPKMHARCTPPEDSAVVARNPPRSAAP